MSALRDAMSHAALGWVKPELDETLRQVRNEVEYFVEDPADTSRMRFCAGYLHQVQGTLRMVELYAPAMVAEELELLADAVRDGAVPDRDEACATLMRGTVLLPDYLERLQNGHRDIPIVLLPLLNEIRAARGAEGINESVLFAFDPEAGRASEAELDHARGSLSGRNRELLDTVGNAVKEELLRIKDALDLHLRTGGETAQLQTQVSELGAVADTLGVMGLGVARGVVVQQRDALRHVVAGNQNIDESMLLDIAGALLYVDASLDDQVAYLGANVDGEEDPGSVETRRTVEVLAHEAIANFASAREAFVAFIETNWDHARLHEVPRLLGEVSGALRMLDLQTPADYLQGVRQYIDVELIGKQRVPSGRQLDTLADAMASLEYYLEALRERRAGREEILDIARTSLETLRYWPLPAVQTKVETPFNFDQRVDDAPLVAGATSAIVEDAVSADPMIAVQEDVAPPAQVAAPAAPAKPYTLVFEAALAPFVPDVAAATDAPPVDAGQMIAAALFDPVSAEEEPGSDAVSYTLAPLELDDTDGTGEPVAPDAAVAAMTNTGFDPVAAEQEEIHGVAADADTDTDTDTSSSPLLQPGESIVDTPWLAAVADEASVTGTPEQPPTSTIELLDDAAPAEAPMSVTVAGGTSAANDIEGQADGTVAATTDSEDASASEEPSYPSAMMESPVEPGVESSADGVHAAVIGQIEVDAEAAAFIAELDAAAAAFEPFADDQGAVPVTQVAVPMVEQGATVSTLEGGFEDSGDEIDQDIREVFIEEFDEELVNLGNLLPVWRAAPANMDRLRPVRRVFHTLKGSGRLVGARTLGEFSWKIESMLNRVLDGSRAPSPAVVNLVTQAYEVLPQLNLALRGAGRIEADLLAMQAVAERVADGEEAFYLASAAPVAAAPAATTATVPPVAGTPASVDSVLREILEAEIAVHLGTVRDWLESSTPHPQPVTEALLRAVHTMSGAFAMTDVPEITAVTTPAETFVKRSLAADMIPAAEGVAVLADTADAIAETIVALQAPAPLIPSFAGLAARIQVLVDALPEAKWPMLSEEYSEDAEDLEPVQEATDVDAPQLESGLVGGDDLSAYFDPDLVRNVDVPASLADVTEEVVVVEEIIAAEMEPPLDSKAPDVAGELEVELPADTVQDDAAVVATPDVSVIAEPEPRGLEADAAGFAGEAEAAAVAISPAALSADIAGVDGDTPLPAVDGQDPGAADMLPEDDIENVPASAAEDDVGGQNAGDGHRDGVEVEDTPGDDALIEAATGLADGTGSTDVEATTDVVQVGDDQVNIEAATTAASEMPAEAAFEPDSALEAEAEAEAEAAEADAPALIADDEMTATDAPKTEISIDAGPLDFSELDLELVDIFVEEGKDLLDHCDGLIHELRSSPEDRELLAGLQRDLHTLKGGARMAGINAIGDLGHGIESLLEAVVANRIEITRSDVHLLERGFDHLHQLLTHTGEHRAVLMPTELIEAFDTRAEGRARAVRGGVAAVGAVEPAIKRAVAAEALVEAEGEAEPSALATVVAVAASIATEPLSAPIVDEATVEEDGVVRSQEQVRVRADLLDRLVNHAGEVAIYRSRLEQQLGAFRGAMSELDRTNARLRDQLRRLDLETEAQIVARYRREQEQVDQTFDPLELDRFSTLQQLSRALNESAADLGGLQGVLDDLSRNYDVLLQQQSRVSSELQDGLMRARMVPFDGLVPRLRRVVRQAAQDIGKQVHLTLEGTHGELDRNVLDRMVAPLEHMLRNSVAHGLETPEQRAASGKPEEGGITLRLRREGSEIVLEVADDGAGLDRAAIRRRAEQRGLIQADAVLGDAELDDLIFASGFSTSEQVSQLAGRGVGMDVVRNEVRQLGGSVDIHSVSGQGVTFTLRLPQTLAVTQAVFVQIGETTFAVPVASVSGIGRIARERFESGDGGYHYNGENYTLHDLGSLVGQGTAKAEGQPQIPLLLVRAGDLRAAVAIDQVVGNREVVVKPVGLQIASVPGIYGATITGDGNVVVILDVAPLVRRHLAQPQMPTQQAAVVNSRQVPMVMVVDDSLTMRKVTGRVLERHNFEVVAARDGIEALERLEERVPDLMLLDIEMPRMDGYELATAMRADQRYKDVPIVMITSRSGDKHRQRALEIGVQRYLGKPYQELDLMRNVYDLLGIARVRE